MTTAQSISDKPTHAGTTLATAVRRPGILLPAISLCRRELVRFLRQRHRVVGALATPLVFWLLIGGGIGRSLSLPGSAGQSYIQFFFPGTLVMILLFTAIFSTISVIEDRREGFLQSVLVAPVSRQAIVLGKVLGGTLLATGQGLVFLVLAPLVGLRLDVVELAVGIGVMLVLSFALTALGFCIAWRMGSSQGFHAIMNLFLMPMWFLSGSLFPPESAWPGLKWIMLANPLTYGLDALRHVLQPPGTVSAGYHTLGLNIIITVAFAAVLYALAAWSARRNVAADLL
jgi:ABC-2 type transport system permease protein